MLRVPLDPGFDGFRFACLRPLAGADELAAAAGTIALLDRLLVAVSEACARPGDAARLPVCDRDRALTELHRTLFDDEVDADATCPRCGDAFELRFSLTTLIAGQVVERPAEVEGPDAFGHFRLGELCFRLPASSDVAAVAALPADRQRLALLAACVVEGDPAGREDEVEAAMAALGPALDVDVETQCPHCQADAPVRFEIGAYLLKCLANERRFVLREVHRIARAYGWSFGEIMALPRSERQEFVRFIDGEAEPMRRPLSLVR
jgi:hypothetical protein